MTAAPADLRLADLTSATAERFEASFDKVQPAPPVRLAALPSGNVDQRTLIAHGFAHARANGWLEPLLTQCFYDGIGSAALLEEAARQTDPAPGSALQSIQNFSRGFGAARIEAEEVAKIIRQVCRIDIGLEPRGTGFLVRSDIVMTAFHVIAELVDGGKAKPGSAAMIQVVFDDYNVVSKGYSRRLKGRVVRVAADWLGPSSACHDRELLGTLPDDLAQLGGKFDYALLKLAGPARVGLPPVQFQSLTRLRKDDPIQIYQHPGGKALAIDRATATEIVGADVRFYHDVNTEGGSSGSPCLDRDYRVVGMHQAGPRNGPGSLRDSKARNRGVPTHHILATLKALPPPAPGLHILAELTETRPGEPVFGRAETQRWAWGEIEAPSRPILVIDRRSGYGQAFTFHILRTLLPPYAHDVVRIAAADLAGQSPEAFAEHLLDQLHYPHAPLPEDSANTTPVHFAKDKLLTALIAQLDAGRKRGRSGEAAERGVWIAIDDLDRTSIGTGSPISDFLYAFYAKAADRPWLRFVLIGAGELAESVRRLVHEERIVEPSDEDLENYLYAKVPSRFQAGLPDFVAVFVQQARDEVEQDLLVELEQALDGVRRSLDEAGQAAVPDPARRDLLVREEQRLRDELRRPARARRPYLPRLQRKMESAAQAFARLAEKREKQEAGGD